MRWHNHLLLIPGLKYGVLTAFICFVATASESQSSFQLDGRVLDGSGNAVAGAAVKLLPLQSPYEQGTSLLGGKLLPEPVAETASRRDGRFTLLDAPSGAWSVRVEKPGFVPMQFPQLFLVSDYLFEPVPLRPDVRLSINGQTGGGEPVWGGFLVRATSASPELWSDAVKRGWRPAARWAISRADDASSIERATLPRAAGESLRYLASGHGYAETGASGVYASETTVALLPAKLVTLRVVDRQGMPVRDVLARTGQGFLPEDLSDDDGQIKITGPRQGSVPVQLLAADGRHAELTLAPGTVAQQPIRVELKEPIRFSGRILDAYSKDPIAEALVWLPRAAYGTVASDRNGYYVVTAGSAAIRYEVRVIAIGYFPSRKPFEAGTPGNDPRPEVELIPASVLRGKIVDERGAPVAAATIRARPDVRDGHLPFGATLETSTLLDGQFQLARLLSGNAYKLRVAAAGFAPKTAEVEPLSPHQQAELTVRLHRGQSAFGIVIDADGAPIVDASVVLIASSRSEPATERFTAATDRDGRFELEHLSLGRYDLGVAASGFAPAVVKGLHVDGPLDVGIVELEPGATIEGVVSDADERPIEDAEVAAIPVTRPSVDLSFASPQPVRTDAEGRFLIPDLERDRIVSLSVSAEGYAPTSVDDVRPPTPEPIHVRLEAVATLAGRVLDPLDEAIGGAEIQASLRDVRVGSDGGSRFHGTTTWMKGTGEDGSFELAVHPGRITLQANAAGFRPSEPEVLEVEGGDRVDGIELALRAGARLEGTVRGPDGRPVPSVELTWLPTSGTAPRNRSVATTDRDGRYRLDGLPESGLHLTAHHERYPRRLVATRIVPGTNYLDVELAAGHTVSGRVVDDVGRLLGSAAVLLEPVETSAAPRLETLSRGDGVFRLDAVADGAYRLKATRAGYAPWRSPLRVRGADRRNLEIRLERGGTVEGRISGLAPGELAALVVFARRPGFPDQPGRLDSDGRYAIPHLTPGPWKILARHGAGQVVATAAVEDSLSPVYVDLDFDAAVPVP